MIELMEDPKLQSKACGKCGVTKTLDDFYSNIATKDGKTSLCKECKKAENKKWRDSNRGKVSQIKKNYAFRNWEAIREHQKKYREKHKVEMREYRRRWNLAKRYGITIDEFTEILDSQGGICAVCGKGAKRQVVDHDHSDGQVRGILCVRCNVCIGGLGDTLEGLMKAVRYLEKANAAKLKTAI